MAEPIDFEQIAQPLIDKLSDTMDPDGAAEWVLGFTRQVWNARGAADIEWLRMHAVVDVVAGELDDLKKLDR